MRDAASASAKTISEVLPPASFQDQYAKLLARLATNQWFTARMSSASLISAAYPRLTREQQGEHLKLFAKLCQDDTPMVRRVAAKHLGKMVENVAAALGRASLADGAAIPSLLLPLYEELASNEQPVRPTDFRDIFTWQARVSNFPPFIVGLCSVANNRELRFLWPCDERVGQSRRAA